jgi:hypothetical protein
MSEQKCEACGIKLTDHFGLYGTCAQRCAWEHIANKLAEALYEADCGPIGDDALAMYERFKFLESRPK